MDKTTQETKCEGVCPACQSKGLGVQFITLQHQLPYTVHSQLSSTDKYYFCSHDDCATAYFSCEKVIPSDNLRTRQAQTEPWLCHCFGVSVQVYQDALNRGEAESIKAFILKQTEEGLCACKLRSPSARCCFAKLTQLEHAHQNRAPAV